MNCDNCFTGKLPLTFSIIRIMLPLFGAGCWQSGLIKKVAMFFGLLERIGGRCLFDRNSIIDQQKPLPWWVELTPFILEVHNKKHQNITLSFSKLILMN